MVTTWEFGEVTIDDKRYWDAIAARQILIGMRKTGKNNVVNLFRSSTAFMS